MGKIFIFIILLRTLKIYKTQMLYYNYCKILLGKREAQENPSFIISLLQNMSLQRLNYCYSNKTMWTSYHN